MDLVAALALLRQSLDTLKALRDIDKAFDLATTKSSLADVMSNLADVRMALIDEQERVREKDAEIARLKTDFQARDELVEHFDFKYRRSKSDPSKPLGFPICPRCEAVDGRLIFTVQAIGKEGAVCPECKQAYLVRRRSEPGPPPPEAS
jgi:hypothetical protein